MTITFQAARFLLLVAALGLALCAPAVADEETSGKDEESLEMGEIVVRAPRIREAADDPASSVTVITPEEFAFEFKTLPEVIARVPGIKIHQYGGLGQLSTVSIRGSSSEQVLVLLDGVPMNTGQGGGVDFSTIPLDAVERIEVIRGGGTAVYGPDAIGGVVNIVTKPPGDRPQATAGMSFGSFDTFKTFGVVRGAVKDVGLLLSATHMQSHGDYTIVDPGIKYPNGKVIPGYTYKRLNNDFKSESILAKADWEITDRWSLAFMSDLFMNNRGQPGKTFLGRQDEDAREENLRNTSSISVVGKDVLIDSLKTTFLISSIFNNILYKDPTGPDRFDLDPIETSNSIHIMRGSLRLDMPWSWTWGSNYLTLTAMAAHHGLRGDVGMDGENYGQPTRSSIDLTIQDEWQFMETKLSLIPILRYTYSSDFGTRVLPKIGLIYRLLWWFSVRANVESSYRPPNFSELYYPDLGWVKGNKDLSPEEAINWDVGADCTFSRIFLQVTYFRRDVENMIYWLPGTYAVIPENTGPADLEGVEVAVEFQPFWLLNIAANYTFLRAIRDDNGEQLAGNPVHTVNGSLSLVHRTGEICIDTRYFDRIPLDNNGLQWVEERVQTDFSVKVDLTELMNWGAIKRLRRAVLAFQIKNIGDVHSLDTIGFTLPGRTFFGTVTLEY
ncbi:TonB-dependent receptor plug domain-containing protein [Thermodesulfobacteriota bacterium]